MGRQGVVARATYLADTSAFTRLNKPQVAIAFGPLIAEGRVALCVPVAFELGFGARNTADYEAIVSNMKGFEFVPVTDGDHQRALQVQGLLARQGQQRMLSLVDALVCAVAESRGLTVLHYDRDFEVVSAVTGQPHHWIVPAGSAD